MALGCGGPGALVARAVSLHVRPCVRASVGMQMCSHLCTLGWSPASRPSHRHSWLQADFTGFQES